MREFYNNQSMMMMMMMMMMQTLKDSLRRIEESYT